MQGIDVSSAQGAVNWQKVHADGVDFAVIKATQGRGEGVLTQALRRIRDSRFTSNITGASAAGLDVSVYHYLTATDVSTSLSEADYFLDTVEPYHAKVTAYAAVDVESKYLSALTPEKLAEVVEVFVQRVYERGFQPLVYTNPSFLVYRFPASFRGRHDIWLAHWNVSKPYSVPNLMMWQYGVGHVDGIAGQVDLDVGYYDTREVIACYRVGEMYTVRAGDEYTSGRRVPSRLVGRKYPILQVRDDALLLGGIVSWVKV